MEWCRSCYHCLFCMCCARMENVTARVTQRGRGLVKGQLSRHWFRISICPKPWSNPWYLQRVWDKYFSKCELCSPSGLSTYCSSTTAWVRKKFFEGSYLLKLFFKSVSLFLLCIQLCVFLLPLPPSLPLCHFKKNKSFRNQVVLLFILVLSF